MSVLALDIGQKRIGIAVSDINDQIAFPHSTLERTDPGKDAAFIQGIALRYKAEEVIYGYPADMSGGETGTGEMIEEYVKELKKTITLPFIKVDERFTSVEAEKRIRESGGKPSRDKGKIDAVAASLILEVYLFKKKKNA